MRSRWKITVFIAIHTIDADSLQIETSLGPMELLDRLQAIEQGHGRVKLIDKGPRNIDLDIAIFRDQVVDSERLTIPHMLMHERDFVLKPIREYVVMICPLSLAHPLTEFAVYRACETG
jgi:7,8-dihydro-6-hydroxymethylpterin-pyrophosphokinase